MAFFVKMTTTDGRDIHVNVDTITRLERYGDYTTIYFDRDNAVSVKDAPVDILAALGGDR
jgi:hypothetical protein